MTEPNVSNRVAAIYVRAGNRLNAIRAQIDDLIAEAETTVRVLEVGFEGAGKPKKWAAAIRNALHDLDPDEENLAELPDILFNIGVDAANEQPAAEPASAS